MVAELKADNAVFLFGYRAKGFIEKFYWKNQRTKYHLIEYAKTAADQIVSGCYFRHVGIISPCAWSAVI